MKKASFFAAAGLRRAKRPIGESYEKEARMRTKLEKSRNSHCFHWNLLAFNQLQPKKSDFDRIYKIKAWMEKS
jgi:hypothetical protein